MSGSGGFVRKLERRELERESCVGGEMKISILSNQFSIPKEKKRKNKKKKIKKLPFHVGRSAAVVRNECKNHFS
jgi:hypothetical protein